MSLEGTQRPHDTGKTKGKGPKEKHAFNLSKHLIGLGQPEKPPANQNNITESDMKKMSKADDGNFGPSSTFKLIKAAETIAREKVNAQLQGVSDEIRNRPVESIPTGKGFVTREEQKVRDISQEIVDQYRMNKDKSEQEARNESLTAKRAYGESGRFGNPFE